MPDVNCSNLSFTSNLQPVGDDGYRGSAFLSKIRDPFALEYMHRQKYSMQPVQEEEYRKASLHCSYAFRGDYPWGTVRDAEGRESVVCRCLNMQCPLLKSCNPEFQPADLKVLLENETTAFLKYDSEGTLRRERQDRGSRVRVAELEEAYRRVMAAASDDYGEEQKKPADQTAASAVAVTGKLSQEQGLLDMEGISAETGVPSEPAAPDLAAGRDLSGDPETYLPVPAVREFLESAEGKSVKPDSEPETDCSMSPAAQMPDAAQLPAEGFSRFAKAAYEDVLNAGPEERMLINAGPGTGKTWTLIQKIGSLVRNPDIDPENVLVLSFSRAAVEEIEKRLKEAEREGNLPPRWHAIDFSTLDSFATRMILYAMNNRPDLLPEGYTLSGQGYDDRIETARNIIRKQPDILDSNVHVLIDEIQDLVGARAGLVLNILHVLDPDCGFTLLGDACQSLYDYQADRDTSVMTSALFYDYLFRDFPDIHYFRFDENHRQSGQLRELIAPFRDAILTGTPEQRRNVLYRIRSGIQSSMINLNRLEGKPNPFETLLKTGSVAILTRSNGEALKISEYLKSAGIRHRLGRPDSEEQLNDWIAAVFTQYSSEMITYEQFCEAVDRVKPDLRGAGVDSCWKALTENVKDEETWYHVSTVLSTVLSRGKNRALYRNGRDESGLTVSNIHRAKGREYDTVLLPESFLDSLITDESDPLNEFKVCYVACTRPKSTLKTVKLNKIYVYRVRKSGRCYESRPKLYKKNQRKLTYLETGLPGDIDLDTLAEERSQVYIRDELNAEDRLVLIKVMQEDGSARYSIRPEKKPELVLGYMSDAFTRELGRLESQLSGRKQYDPLYYPSEMDNIVVTKKTTCISAGERKREGVKYFGDAGIWYGFSAAGFAHVITNRY